MIKKYTLMLFAFATAFSYAQVNYTANGGSSFGGVIGNSTMSINDDGTNISITIDRAGNFDGNDMVIYVDNGNTGRTVIDGTVNDANDDGRRMTSAIGAGDLTFPPGFEATHAIYGDQFFMGIYEIPATGNINNGDLVFVRGVGDANADPFTLTFTKADIGIASGDPVNFSFVASYANPNDNGALFRSNEGYGDGILNNGNQNAAAAVTFTTYLNYPSGDKYGVATTSAPGFWDADTTWSNGNPPSANDQITISHNVSINTNVTIENSLTASNGTIVGVEGNRVFTLNGDLIVQAAANFGFNSDANGSAQFLNDPSATITGEVGVARFIPTGSGSSSHRKAYRFITSSVDATQPIYENWQTGGMSLPGIGIHITGSTTGANGFDQTVSGNPSVLTYGLDTADNTYKWTFLDNTDTKTFTAGEAFNVFVRGDRNYNLSTDLAPNTDVRIPSRGALNLSSTVNSGALNPNAGGFSFVGNPYQATVDWTTITKNNINPNFIYLWDPMSGSNGLYQTIDFTSGAPAERYIQPGQAFFVTTVAAGAASLDFKASDKTPSQNAVGLFSTPTNRPKIAITLFKDFNGDQTVYDRLTLNLDGDNAVNLNDAVKAPNLEENLSVNAGGTLLSIENRAMPVHNEVIQLNFADISSTTYTMNIDLNGLTTGLNAILHDNFLNTDTVLNDGLNTVTASFDLNDPASTVADRFELRFVDTTLSISQVEGFTFQMFPNPVSTSQLTIRGAFNQKKTSVTFYNTLGQQVLSTLIKSDESTIDIQDLDAGIYLVRVISGEQTMTKKLIIK